ncbi:MAG: Maf family protein [Christensenellales bacterium]|jgi:septum formation protein
MIELIFPLVLASASPRRRELLSMLGLPFTCVVSGADEDAPPCAPEELVQELARAKAFAALPLIKEPSIIVGADTIVLLDGEILGKPKDEEDARAMLRRLQGRTHIVLTGLCVLNSENGKYHLDYERTEVTFAAMTEEEISDYVSTGEPMDKAGAYGIQGRCAVHISGSLGCYFNVVGLPLHKLATMLKSFAKPAQRKESK